jgi:hypothetical protein
MPSEPVNDCLNCRHFKPCSCRRDYKGFCEADNGSTVYVDQNKNCPDWEEEKQ